MANNVRDIVRPFFNRKYGTNNQIQSHTLPHKFILYHAKLMNFLLNIYQMFFLMYKVTNISKMLIKMFKDFNLNSVIWEDLVIKQKLQPEGNDIYLAHD